MYSCRLVQLQPNCWFFFLQQVDRQEVFIYKFWLICGSHCDYFVFVYLSQASGSHRDDIAPVDVDGFLNTSGGASNNNPHTPAEWRERRLLELYLLCVNFYVICEWMNSLLFVICMCAMCYLWYVICMSMNLWCFMLCWRLPARGGSRNRKFFFYQKQLSSRVNRRI